MEKLKLCVFRTGGHICRKKNQQNLWAAQSAFSKVLEYKISAQMAAGFCTHYQWITKKQN